MPGTITPSSQANSDNDGPPAHVVGVYYLTHPRSASNLFQNMMSKQPGYQNSGYKLFDSGFHFMRALAADKGPFSAWPAEERQQMYDDYKNAFEAMQDELEDAKKNGKKVFIKEHAYFLWSPDKIYADLYPNQDGNLDPCTVHERHVSPEEAASLPHTNPSSLPDNFLLSFQPVFQIRHPVLMFPSAIRAQRGINIGGHCGVPDTLFGKVTLSLRRSRELYDWYLTHGPPVGIHPRIIDADDVMRDPSAVRKLCLQTGLDPDAVQYEWEAKAQDAHPAKARFLSTISASRGILPGFTASEVDVEREKEKWVVEFGEVDGKGLADKVDAAMGDYEYLWERRTTGGGGEVGAP
ncbi:P-loop containing nucleoside triphosphate hydrolase [Pyrenophora seminiperda CCB06]|uniref:P-loop containing nucleoside triphosphate hydrolase n=1 Tax=Pyrenophora seminiperda CCB06 TaxID=1302712 RepID=A0A3M7M9Y2_9PLEO|nr:P-loop containing nucleoside triphosphate hydrolase [Pyrenophora seminiperda CCB06]